MLKYQIVPVTNFAQNCSVIWEEDSLLAAVIDPGGDIPLIQSVIEKHHLIPQFILLTHGHVDHIGQAYALSQVYQIPIIGPQKEDAFLIAHLPIRCQEFGFPPGQAFEPERWLEDGDVVKLGQIELQVLYTPGHTPGHVTFYQPQIETAWVGDVLFRESIGRTDLPGGDFATLAHSIRHKLFTLPENTKIIPGHGPMTTLAYEQVHNPFVGKHARF